jgi:hypothetical protein
MLTRRGSLILPLLLADCGGRGAPVYQPPHYDYLLQLQLDVATIRIDQRFTPSGTPPDVSHFAPVQPVLALRTMADDRLRALGSVNEAVFVIQDASLVRQRDTISGTFVVELDIYTAPEARVGYAQATVSGTFTGDLDDLPMRLYNMTNDMMTRMNIEFEYQVRRSLGPWLLPAGASPTPVEQQPLTQTPPAEPPPEPTQ